MTGQYKFNISDIHNDPRGLAGFKKSCSLLYGGGPTVDNLLRLGYPAASLCTPFLSLSVLTKKLPKVQVNADLKDFYLITISLISFLITCVISSPFNHMDAFSNFWEVLPS